MHRVHRLWLRTAWLAGLCAIAPAAPALELAGLDPPRWVHGAEQASGKGCSAVRARRPAELPAPWRALVRRITLQCTPMAGASQEPDASTESVATLRPGAATLRGVPVLALRLSESWAHGDTQYLLDVPPAEAAARLGAYVKARCLSQAAPAAATEGHCEPAPGDARGGSFTRTGELGGIRLYADPGDARRTVLSEAWSE